MLQGPLAVNQQPFRAFVQGGLPQGAVLPEGVTLLERIPSGHKVALRDIATGEPVRRYDVTIGYAAEDLPAGTWVNETRLSMPAAPGVEDLPISTNLAPSVYQGPTTKTTRSFSSLE